MKKYDEKEGLEQFYLKYEKSKLTKERKMDII